MGKGKDITYAGVYESNGRYSHSISTNKKPRSVEIRMIAHARVSDNKQTLAFRALEKLVNGLNDGLVEPTINEITRRLTEESGFSNLTYYGQPPAHAGESQLKDHSQILPGESYRIHEFIGSKVKRNTPLNKKQIKGFYIKRKLKWMENLYLKNG